MPCVHMRIVAEAGGDCSLGTDNISNGVDVVISNNGMETRWQKDHDGGGKEVGWGM